MFLFVAMPGASAPPFSPSGPENAALPRGFPSITVRRDLRVAGGGAQDAIQRGGRPVVDPKGCQERSSDARRYVRSLPGSYDVVMPGAPRS